MSVWTKYRLNGEKVTRGWVCNNCDSWNNKATPFCPYCGDKAKTIVKDDKDRTVDDFIEASNHEDWINQPTESVYHIYWQWCIKNGVSPENKIVFVRTVLQQFPDLKSAPMKGKRYFRKMW